MDSTDTSPALAGQDARNGLTDSRLLIVDDDTRFRDRLAREGVNRN